jgi:hypothetical protein
MGRSHGTKSVLGIDDVDEQARIFQHDGMVSMIYPDRWIWK